MNQWFRHYEGMVTDIKFPIVARRANSKIEIVFFIWNCLLEHASSATDRGNITGFDPEAVDVILGLEFGHTERVVKVMQDKGIIKDGRVVGWDHEQPSEDGK